jgi:hypothetical protein
MWLCAVRRVGHIIPTQASFLWLLSSLAPVGLDSHVARIILACVTYRFSSLLIFIFRASIHIHDLRFRWIDKGGSGGCMYSSLNVTVGAELTIAAGCMGVADGAGGYGGGGSSGYYSFSYAYSYGFGHGSGGGGASYIMDGTKLLIIGGGKGN